MSAVYFLLVAVLISGVGSAVVVLRQRKPTGTRNSIESLLNGCAMARAHNAAMSSSASTSTIGSGCTTRPYRAHERRSDAQPFHAEVTKQPGEHLVGVEMRNG